MMSHETGALKYRVGGGVLWVLWSRLGCPSEVVVARALVIATQLHRMGRAAAGERNCRAQPRLDEVAVIDR